jgi:hypothetical protein
LDIAFVDRVKSDFHRCQIDTWLDTDEIRHGHPWLDAIFEHGIQRCDAVLVYFTENSLDSKIVKKEVDSGILATLEEEGVAFLPYVAESNLRNRLRPDIRALQVPEWNDQNYDVFLPEVVSEVWRCFMERIVGLATQKEKARRLELELELQRVKKKTDTDVFSESEILEFKYILEFFDQETEIQLDVAYGNDRNTYFGTINLSSVVSLLPPVHRGSSTKPVSEFGLHILDKLEKKVASDLLPAGELDPDSTTSVTWPPDLENGLLTVGLIRRVEIPVVQEQRSPFVRARFSYVFTEKMYRFHYWLIRTGRVPEKVKGNIE